MIHLPQPEQGVEYLAGKVTLQTGPLPTYDESVLEFLDALSSQLRKSAFDTTLTDVSAFAFWCRRRHLDELSSQLPDRHQRLGRGFAFHIAPENVPINFAYSLVFGLLAGNANVVRVPTKRYESVDVVCSALHQLMGQDAHQAVGERIAVVRYERNDAMTAQFSSQCDARIIWGGDETVTHVRSLPIPASAVELTFADRYSLCLLNAAAVRQLDDNSLKQLTERFFNDVYFMDQNACSSPHLVLWVGQDVDAEARFWASLQQAIASKYEMEPAKAVAKYTALCEAAMAREGLSLTASGSNLAYRLQLDQLEGDVTELRGQFGMFFEHHLEDIGSLRHVVNRKFQTLTYFGFERDELAGKIVESRFAGIDRVVPVGRALDMDVIWDGYDVIANLSRRIAFN